MKVIKINPENPNPKTINITVEILKAGGLVVYPTDTAYGLGANALDVRAIKKLYKIKGRAFTQPTHVVVKDWQMINKFCLTNTLAKKVHDKFLPGPLTIIVNKRKKIPDILTANLSTIGVRIPKNEVTRNLSRLLDFPYTTTSANHSGGNTPYSTEEVANEIDISKIDLILDAGKLPKITPSTIVDVSKNISYILRKGPITEKEIDTILKI